MEEETINTTQIGEPLYWTTDAIKNWTDLVFDKRVSKQRYDELLRRFNTQEQAYKELSEKYGKQRQDLFEFKDAVKIILRHYN